MAGKDDLLAVIGAVYDAGLDAALWPKALAGMTRLVGGAAATLEIFGKQNLRPRQYYFHGVPKIAEIKYVEHYAGLNPRLPVVARHPIGEICWDYRILDETAIGRDPFYMEFLASIGLRYFVDGIVATDRDEFAGVIVHRSAKQGHIDRAGLALMERLLPHVKGAFDVARRLKGAGEARHSLERALDWLADGIALLRADGALVYANNAFQTIARAGDGIQIAKGIVELATGDGRSRLLEALAETTVGRRGETRGGNADFTVRRPSGAPAYLISVRPVPNHGRERGLDPAADAIVFVRDPLSRNAAALRTLREVLGLTDAEAGLAQALQTGIPLGDYAVAQAVTLNTVYTHLRHIKEKTGCRRLPELIRKLNDLQVPLRLD